MPETGLPPRLSPIPGARFLLGSASPRRHQLMGMIVPAFTVVHARDVEETYPPGTPVPEIPAYLSRLKAAPYVAGLAPADVLITADTIVIDPDGGMMGKPRDHRQAVEMLMALQGRTHTVVTGVTITLRGGHQDTFSAATEVTFAPVERSLVEDYVSSYSPLDKAGAYGIQEWIGAVAIQSVHGSFYNVMGLPTHQLWRHLRALADRFKRP